MWSAFARETEASRRCDAKEKAFMKGPVRGVIWLTLLAALLTCGCRACGTRGGESSRRRELVTEPDGGQRYRVTQGAFQAYYDRWGRLERIERDSNSDGRVDQVSHHAGQKDPALVVLDTDFDGGNDRWEYYDASGRLTRIGATRGGGAPDMWVVVDVTGKVSRREYDDDRDGKVDRAEDLENGRITWTEVDSDRDGKVDRWQLWTQGRLAAEDLDLDGDAKPDRRVLFGSDGRVQRLERLKRE
jgi:hypothetical protein